MKYQRADLLRRIVIASRNGKIRVGTVVSVGPKSVGVKVADMATKMKIPVGEDKLQLVEVKAYMTLEAYEELAPVDSIEIEIEIDIEEVKKVEEV